MSIFLEYEERIAELEAENARLKEKRKTLNDWLCKLRGFNVKFSELNSELRFENARLTGLLESVEASANETLVDLGHAQQEIDRLEAENARLKARVEEVEGFWFTLTQTCNDLREEIERLRESQRWIPVSERLPVRDGQYLVTLEGATTDLDILFYSHSEGYSWDLWGKGRVTHWREIELPAEGK